ncbi:MAG: 23S rRNA (adenine(2503)-C(2))-methyltransferase RlmN [Thermodesulfovibrionales bacterium]|nr:23S rRNA (adenine(2503)-C(2))-methyltransferase RlmN [Thermodesulfovibrionales bacterium]
MSKINLKSLSKDKMKEFVKAQGLPAYRAKQMLHWIYEKKAASIDQITELSKEAREKLSDSDYISNLELLSRQTSKDGTEKFLFGLEDRESIESVLIPDKDRLTLCISSQVGCAMGCSFCLTGKIGFKRNLKAHEIVDQIIAVSRLISENHHPIPPLPRGGERGVTNIVFMGMGEPLLNLDEVIEALKRITGLMGISKKRITLSTCGIAPKIAELYKKAPHVHPVRKLDRNFKPHHSNVFFTPSKVQGFLSNGVNLAISLNAADNKTRDIIMPINKKYPLETLLASCRKIPFSPRTRITFEYVMLDGVNDKPSDAQNLVRILRGIPSKVNLIPFNPYEGSKLKRPSDEKVFVFQKILTNAGMNAFIRKSKGQDILAACGQLKAGYGAKFK